MGLYEELDVPQDASSKDIKRAFRNKIKKEHPDTGGSHDSSSRLIKAYQVLIDPEKRKKYDETGDTSDSVIIDNEQASRMKLAALFQAMIRPPQLDVQHTDVVAEMQKVLHKEIQGGNNQLAELQATLNRCSLYRQKLTTKGKATFMEGSIGQIETETKQGMELITKQLAITDLCTAILLDASFTFEPRVAPTISTFNMGTSAVFTGFRV